MAKVKLPMTKDQAEREARRLRYEAYYACLDDRVKLSRKLNKRADRLDRQFREVVMP